MHMQVKVMSNVKRLLGERVVSAWLAGLTLAGAGAAGCAGDGASMSAEDNFADAATRARIDALAAELAGAPGELVVTHSDGPSLDDATRARLVGATKLIHVYSDSSVVAYLAQPREIPGEPAPRRYVREHGGDVVIGPSNELPDHIIEREAQLAGARVDRAVGLAMTNGALWRDGTVGYEIAASFSSASERAVLLDAIGSWNNAVDGGGQPIRVRFVPRYQNDGRAYVRFVRTSDPGSCGSSQVGNHASSSTGYSHDINITCVTKRTIQHEMGHTAGLWHEQQRCDRSSYVLVGGTGINCDRHCESGTASYAQYNYRSVMHYPYYNACSITPITPAETNYRGVPADAGAATQLDAQDVQAINAMYAAKRSMPPTGVGIYYYLTPQHVTSRTVAVPAASPLNRVQLFLWDRFGYPDQQWQLTGDGNGYYEVRNHATGKCMEDLDFLTSDGGAVAQFDCVNGDNQKWIIAPSSNDPAAYDLINKYSMKSLDAYNAETSNTTTMIQWPHHGGPNQRFQLIRAL